MLIRGTPSVTTSVTPPWRREATVRHSLDCSREVLQNLIISNNLNFMAASESASNQASLRQGGGCEALGGSSSFTQNYLFKQYYKSKFTNQFHRNLKPDGKSPDFV